MDSKGPIAWQTCLTEHQDWLEGNLATYTPSSLQWLLCAEGSESHTLNSVWARQVLWRKGSQKTKPAVSEPRWHPPSHSGEGLSLKPPYLLKGWSAEKRTQLPFSSFTEISFSKQDWTDAKKKWLKSQTPRPEPRELPPGSRVVSRALIFHKHHWPRPSCLQPPLLLPMKKGMWVFAHHCVIGCLHARKRAASVPFLLLMRLLPT